MSQHSHLYKTRQWQARRLVHIKRHPLCAYCLKLGKVTPATVADHIEPHKGDLAKFRGPLQSLCATCHSSAKAKEERRGKSIAFDALGNPIDREW